MPKAKAQKRYRGSTSPTKTTTDQSRQRNASTPLSVALEPQQDEQSQQILRANAQVVLARKNRSGSTQALVMAGMVAVGCWGLAFTFIFLTTTQNHMLIGGMIAVMALMWSFSFVMRIRKARRY